MITLNKWMRQIHRWLVFPFTLAILLTIIGTISQGEAAQVPIWLNVMAIGSLLLLLLTGFYMFVQYYWVRWRRTVKEAKS
jgi:ABC-type nickel/cobalt efflux system permease component RcnA